MGIEIFYPEKIISPEVMHYAKTLEDIREQIKYVMVDDVSCQDIFQQYNSDKWIVSLWFSRSVFSWSSGRIKAFHTANLFGLEQQQRIDDTIFFRTHVLQSRIKYLWKDLFGKTLDFFKEQWVYSVSITPFQSSWSLWFYKKMIDMYANRILEVCIHPNDDISLVLK